MPTPIRVPNPRGEMVEPPEVSASDAKNGFGRILERVAREGGVTITRRHEPVAVVIPVETYRRLAAAEAGSLETLSAEFDALLARMQAPGVGAAMAAGVRDDAGGTGPRRGRRRRHGRSEQRAVGARHRGCGRKPTCPAHLTPRRGARRRSSFSPAATARARAASAARRCDRPAPTITTRTRRPGGSRPPTGSRSPPLTPERPTPRRGTKADGCWRRQSTRSSTSPSRRRSAAARSPSCWIALPRTASPSTSGSSASRPSTCISIGFAVAPPRAATTSRKRRCASASGADAKT